MEPNFGKNEDDDLSLAKAYDAKGTLLQSYGKLTGAKAAFTAYHRVCERMMTRYDGRYERVLSISYERLGDICTAQGDLSGAKDYYLKALAIRERLAAESEGTQAKDDLAVSYYKIGTFEGTDRNERIGYLQKAKAIWADLAKATGIDEYRRRMNIAESLIHEAQTSASSEQAPAPEAPAESSASVESTPAPETPAESTPAPESSPKKSHLAGKIIGALLVAGIVALVALQLTGVMDILGWLKGLFG